MTALLRAELLKLRTTRTFVVLAGLAAGLSMLLAGLSAGLADENTDKIVTEVFATDLSSVFVLILAIVGITGEWRHRTITSSLLAEPDRVRFLGGQDARLRRRGPGPLAARLRRDHARRAHDRPHPRPAHARSRRAARALRAQRRRHDAAGRARRRHRRRRPQPGRRDRRDLRRGVRRRAGARRAAAGRRAVRPADRPADGRVERGGLGIRRGSADRAGTRRAGDARVDRRLVRGRRGAAARARRGLAARASPGAGGVLEQLAQDARHEDVDAVAQGVHGLEGNIGRFAAGHDPQRARTGRSRRC